ncbi:MAG TPA: nuclear transport factor 2 family protein [Acidobacteriota bacterium]|jgi:ketosteroid isomerase-like protein
MTAKTPKEVDDLFVKYMREGDLESVLNLYDAEIAFVNQNGEILKGISAIRDQLAHFAESKQVFEFQIERIVLNGDIALVHNKYEMITPNKKSGYAIEVMRRQPDGSWRFFIGDPFTLGKTFTVR